MTTLQTQYMPAETQSRRDLDIRPGDTVSVATKIQEKGKTRIQKFQGLVIARKHGRENGGTITVRKVSSGVGVERIFPLYSPTIESIEVLRRARVRKSKLGFLRKMSTKKISAKLRKTLGLPVVPERTEEEVDVIADLTTDQDTQAEIDETKENTEDEMANQEIDKEESATEQESVEEEEQKTNSPESEETVDGEKKIEDNK